MWQTHVAALPAEAGARWRQARAAAMRTPECPLAFVPETPTRRADLEAAVAEARAWYEERATARRRWRAEQWWQFVQRDVATGGRRTFRWVRQPALQAPPPLIEGPRGLEGGPAAVLRHAAGEWHPLWDKADQQHPDELALLRTIRELPPFPSLPPLSDDVVEQAVARLPLGRAPGPDDWAGDELRRWPRPLLRALAALLRKVEELGRWPAGLQAAEVVLLPKPGGDPNLPLHKRPITLLPVIYRLWARLRLRQVDAWRASWDPAVTALPKGPEGQAWDLAWELAVAPACGQTVCGAAVDFSKCYDSVRLPLLRRVLAAAGWPTGILGPLMAA